MGGALAFMIILGLALLGVPVGMIAIDKPLGGFASAIMMGSGLVFLVLAGTAIIITKLYQKVRADEALVKTGMGGLKVIKDGGKVIIPVLHEVVRVPLRTFRLEVARNGPQALLTQDKLRADIRAEFFIRIQDSDEDIVAASRSLGNRADHEQQIKQLIEDKLVSALRTVAATKTLEDLNAKREEFVRAVAQSVETDLKHNGFKLESATISALDQADASTLRDDNVFDAEGKLTIAQITQDKMTQRNLIERTRAQERLAQDVEAKKKMLDLERERAEAEARQQADIAQAQAEQSRLAREKQITADRQVELAVVEKQKQLEVAARQQQEAAEVAERNKQRAIAVADAERAKAEAGRAKAEAEAERERQQVQTVAVTEEAERNKRREVITAQAGAERKYVEAQRQADAEAYAVKAQAEAKKAAADADAEAIRKRAEAEADAQTKRAEGQRAADMVPVQVQQATVEVELARANVEIRLLEQREKFGRAGIELEVTRLQIEAGKAIGIAQAEAAGEALGSARMELWGTPEMLDKVMSRFMTGRSLAEGVNGFFGAASPETKALLGAAGAVAKKLAEKLGIPVEEAERAIREAAAGNGEAEAGASRRKKDKPAAEPA